MIANQLFKKEQYLDDPEELDKAWAKAIYIYAGDVVEESLARFKSYKIKAGKMSLPNIGKMYIDNNNVHNLLNFDKKVLGNPSVVSYGKVYNNLSSFLKDNQGEIGEGKLFLSRLYEKTEGIPTAINYLSINPDELKNFGWDKSEFLYYDGPALLGNFKIGGFKSPAGGKIVYSGDDLFTPEEIMSIINKNTEIS